MKPITPVSHSWRNYLHRREVVANLECSEGSWWTHRLGGEGLVGECGASPGDFPDSPTEGGPRNVNCACNLLVFVSNALSYY